MDDFYPEWGPSRNRDDEFPASPRTRRARYWQAGSALVTVGAGSPEPRDADRDRPDDN